MGALANDRYIILNNFSILVWYMSKYMGLGKSNSLKLIENKRIELVDISELDEVSVIIFLVDLCR